MSEYVWHMLACFALGHSAGLYLGLIEEMGIRRRLWLMVLAIPTFITLVAQVVHTFSAWYAQ